MEKIPLHFFTNYPAMMRPNSACQQICSHFSNLHDIALRAFLNWGQPVEPFRLRNPAQGQPGAVQPPRTDDNGRDEEMGRDDGRTEGTNGQRRRSGRLGKKRAREGSGSGSAPKRSRTPRPGTSNSASVARFRQHDSLDSDEYEDLREDDSDQPDDADQSEEYDDLREDYSDQPHDADQSDEEYEDLREDYSDQPDDADESEVEPESSAVYDPEEYEDLVENPSVQQESSHVLHSEDQDDTLEISDVKPECSTVLVQN